MLVAFSSVWMSYQSLGGNLAEPVGNTVTTNIKSPQLTVFIYQKKVASISKCSLILTFCVNLKLSFCLYDLASDRRMWRPGQADRPPSSAW